MLDRQFARLGLITEGIQLLDRGADEDNPVLRAGPREIRVFGQEAVACRKGEGRAGRVGGREGGID